MDGYIDIDRSIDRSIYIYSSIAPASPSRLLLDHLEHLLGRHSLGPPMCFTIWTISLTSVWAAACPSMTFSGVALGVTLGDRRNKLRSLNAVHTMHALHTAQ